MILKELADLARREHLVDDPDFEPKPVRWVVGPGRRGKFLGEILEESPANAKVIVNQVVIAAQLLPHPLDRDLPS